ncbi:MAG: Hsp70 family protein [Spirochaetota bacterium]
MAGSVIGIKIADGTFFPVLERSHRGKRKLVLTTVNDQQESVQIDLYQGEDDSMQGAEYVGSLVVGNIQPAAEGEAEINLVLGIDQDGNLNATASDASTGEYESLSVSLESREDEPYTVPDFQLDEQSLDEQSLDEQSLGEAEQLNDFDADMDLDMDRDFNENFAQGLEESTSEASSEFGEQTLGGATQSERQPEAGDERGEEAPIAFSRPADGQPPTPRKGGVLLFLGFMILSLAALALLGFLVYRLLRGPEMPPLEAQLQVVEYALLPLAMPYFPRGVRRHHNDRNP